MEGSVLTFFVSLCERQFVKILIRGKKKGKTTEKYNKPNQKKKERS